MLLFVLFAARMAAGYGGGMHTGNGNHANEWKRKIIRIRGQWLQGASPRHCLHKTNV